MKPFNRTACEAIVSQLRHLVQEEHRIENEILRLMKQVYEKRWHLEMGYSSMFDFLVKDSGMAAATAQRRVQALKLFEEAPLAAQMMRDGKLTLSNAAEIYKAVQTEKKLGSGPEVSLEEIFGQATSDIGNESSQA